MAIFDFLFGQQDQSPQGNGFMDQRTAMAMANQPQPNPSADASGILAQLGPGALSSDPGFLKKLANGLMAAGSPNPAQALMELQIGDREAAKASRPKVEPLANGAFSLITLPGKPPQIVPNKDVQDYLLREAQIKNTFALDRIGAQARAQIEVAGGKDDTKRGGDARSALNDTQGLIGRYQQAYDVVMPIQKDAQGNPILGEDGQPVRAPRPMTKQAMALPGFKQAAEFFGMDGASDNLKLQEIKVDETLLKTAETKGAISNQEMNEFKSPLPSPWADAKVWEEQVKKRMATLRKIEEFQKSEIARGENATSRVTSPSANTKAPAPSNVQTLSEADVTAKGLQFDPAYEYALVNGQIKRRKK